MVIVAFQSTFYLKIHQNNIFFIFLKISFDQNDLKKLKKFNLKQKNIFLKYF
jgi:hypothetical protein